MQVSTRCPFLYRRFSSRHEPAFFPRKCPFAPCRRLLLQQAKVPAGSPGKCFQLSRSIFFLLQDLLKDLVFEGRRLQRSLNIVERVLQEICHIFYPNCTSNDRCQENFEREDVRLAIEARTLFHFGRILKEDCPPPVAQNPYK